MRSPAQDPEIPRLHADYVRKLARSLVFDDALADDVAQDVWLAALEHGPRDRRSLRAWLATVARNFAAKAWRGDSHRSARERVAARAESVPSAEEILERESVRRGVVEAVLALDEPYRSTIVLRYFEDLGPREVARRLDVSVETVRTREKRAREMLRARLDREHGSDRRAWSIALVRDLRLEPPMYAGSIVIGGFVMSTVKVIAGGAAALLLLLGTLAWIETRRAPELGRQDGVHDKGSPLTGLDPDQHTAGSDRLALAPTAGSSTAAPEDPRGSLRVRVRWGDDHSPASDVGVQVEDEQGKIDFQWIDARTGPDGSCTLEHLRPGKFSVNSDRPLVGRNSWEAVDVDVAPNGVAEVTLELAPGIAVDGEVVDAEGKPVAGAEVFLSLDQVGWPGQLVARAGADGRFKIRAAPPGACLSAHFAGRSPSLRPRLKGPVGSEAHVRLILPGPGGDLDGVVTDADGAPVVGARIVVGGEDYRDAQFVEGETLHTPASRLASTDELGRFRIEGLPPGASPIAVRARDSAQWKSMTEVRAGETTHCDVRLAKQVVVEGSVRDAGGHPVARALVGLEGPDTFLWVLTRTSEDGCYRLVGLPVGDFHLKATVRSVGTAEVDLHGVAGAVLQWDAVISNGRSIAGRIVGATPELGKLYVQGRPTKLGRGGVGSVEPDGSFRMIDLEDQPYDVVVFGATNLPLASVRGVSPGAADVVVTIDPARLPSSRIRGRLVGPGNKPVGAEVRLSLQDGNPFLTSTLAQSDPETGTFDAGLLTPGDWTLTISATGLVRQSTPPHALAANETWDVGEIVLSAGGVLVVTAKLEDGSEPPVIPNLSLLFVTSTDADWGEPLTPVGGVSRSGPLLPGQHMLRIAGDLDSPVACDLIPFQIVVGEETRLDLVLHAGRKITISIRDPSTSPSPTTVQGRLARMSGTNITVWGVRDVRDGRYETSLRLLDGEYRVDATAQDGRKATGIIRVGADGPDTFELELGKP